MAGLTVITAVPVPVIFASSESIVSTVELSETFFITMSLFAPASTSTVSSKVIIKFALTATPVAPSVGDKELTTGGPKTPAYSKAPMSVLPLRLAPLWSVLGTDIEPFTPVKPLFTEILVPTVIA